MESGFKFLTFAGLAFLVLGCDGNTLEGQTEDAEESTESQVARNSSHPDMTRERVDRVNISKVADVDNAFDFNDTYYKTMARVENMIETLQYRQSRRADTISVQYCSLSVVRSETNIAIIEDDIIENYSVNTQELLDCAGFLSCNSRTVKSCLNRLHSRATAPRDPEMNIQDG